MFLIWEPEGTVGTISNWSKKNEMSKSDCGPGGAWYNPVAGRRRQLTNLVRQGGCGSEVLLSGLASLIKMQVTKCAKGV